jgi:transposase
MILLILAKICSHVNLKIFLDTFGYIPYFQPMYIESVPNRNSSPAVLLRESYRDSNGKVKKRTLANLTCLDLAVIATLKRALKGEKMVAAQDAFAIISSKAHGHVQAVLTAMQRLGLSSIIDSKSCRERNLVLSMIASRILEPHSKLATVRWWQSCTLADEFKVSDMDEDKLYEALDWLLERQEQIESRLVARHLRPGDFAFYDLSSSYYEGEMCPLAQYGYNCDKKRGKRQINYGLLCEREGRPLAVGVWPGNTSDPKTFIPTMQKLKQKYGLSQVVMVGDRGMLTSQNINLLNEEGAQWISALRSISIRNLMETKSFQLSLFDENNIWEFYDQDNYPGERLIACRNPILAAKRKRVRDELLTATEIVLTKIRKRVESGKLKNADKIGLTVGRCIDKYKVSKHFIVDIEEEKFNFRRDEKNITQEALLDGIYIVRTSISSEILDAPECVRQYKNLSRVERAFRTMKTMHLKIRLIYHRLDKRVRAHIFLNMLAYYVEWHMREAWRSMTFCDEDKEARAVRDPVAPAQRSTSAARKISRRTADDGTPLHDFRTLLSELASVVKNSCRVSSGTALTGEDTFSMLTQMNPTQEKSLHLLQNMECSR